MDALLDVQVAGKLDLLLQRNRVDVIRRGGEAQQRARAVRLIDHLLDEIVGALGTVGGEDAVERVEPLARFLGILVGLSVERHEVGLPCPASTRIDHFSASWFPAARR